MYQLKAIRMYDVIRYIVGPRKPIYVKVWAVELVSIPMFSVRPKWLAPSVHHVILAKLQVKV